MSDLVFVGITLISCPILLLEDLLALLSWLAEDLPEEVNPDNFLKEEKLWKNNDQRSEEKRW